MLILDPGLPDAYQGMVRRAVGQIAEKLQRHRAPALPQDFVESLAALLDGTASCLRTASPRSASVAYGDRYVGPQHATPYAYTAGGCIWLCQRAFDAKQDRVNAVLLHELVHVACGWELDAEAFETLLFGAAGATPPDPMDLQDFAWRNWTGRWVSVVRHDGRILVRNRQGATLLSSDSTPRGPLMNALAVARDIPRD